jgi:hypothetical protein
LAIWTRILTRPKKKNALVLMSSGQLSLKKWIAGWSNDEFPPKKRMVYWVILQNLKKKKRNKSKHMFLSPKKKRKKHDPLTKF